MITTQTIRKHVDNIDQLQKRVNDIKINLARLNNQEGQKTASVIINGVQFDISTLDRESGWQPYTIECYKGIHEEAVKITEVFLRQAITNLEEAKFKFIQLSKEI